MTSKTSKTTTHTNAAKTARVVGRPFPKGVSGNKAGRPVGSRHSVSIACQNMVDGESGAIMRKAIELAKTGDPSALKLCVERILPLRKGRTIDLKTPPIENAADAAKALNSIVTELATGQLTPEEAANVASVFEVHRKTIETCEFEQRIKALEAANARR